MAITVKGYDSAGVGYTEKEVFSTSLGPDILAVAVVGGAVKGPDKITLVSTQNQCLKKFGNPIEDGSDFGVLAALETLKNSNLVYYYRVQGESAAKGTAGDAQENQFIFTTKDTDSTLNGATVEIYFDEKRKSWGYKLISDGVLLENYRGFSLDEQSDNYLPKKLTEVSSYLSCERTEIPLDTTKEETNTVEEVPVTAEAITVTAENLNTPSQAVDEGHPNNYEVTIPLAGITDKTEYTFSVEITLPDSVTKITYNNGEIEAVDHKVTVDLTVKAEECVSGGSEKSFDLTCSYVPTSDSEVYGHILIKFNKEAVKPATTTSEVEVKFSGLKVNISGADDGISSITPKNLAEAIAKFSSPENIDISTIIVPGHSEPEVIDALTALCNYRGDCMAIIDPPKDLNPQEVVAWSNGIGVDETETPKLDNEFFATYYPWVQVRSPISSSSIWCPPSVVVASQWCFSDSKSEQWFAPAGYGSAQRGVLDSVSDIAYELSKEDRDLIYSNTDDNVINPIAKFIGKGCVLWGNKTTKRTPDFAQNSCTTALNVRRLLNYIRKVVTNVSLNTLFEPNEKTSWSAWKLACEPYFRAIKINRGLDDYKLIMDETTVTEEDRKAGRAPAIIWVKPIRAIEYIPMTLYATESSVVWQSIGSETTEVTDEE